MCDERVFWAGLGLALASAASRMHVLGIACVLALALSLAVDFTATAPRITTSGAAGVGVSAKTASVQAQKPVKQGASVLNPRMQTDGSPTASSSTLPAEEECFAWNRMYFSRPCALRPPRDAWVRLQESMKKDFVANGGKS